MSIMGSIASSLYKTALQKKDEEKKVKAAGYVDPSGQSKTGYLIGGKTYEDEAGTKRVGIGSIVDTEGGKYVMTEKGGTPYSDYLNQLGTGQISRSPASPTVSAPSASDFYKDYLSMYEGSERALNTASEAAAGLLNSQKRNALSDIDRQVADAQQQAYVTRMQGEKNIPAILGASGYTGGMAETTALAPQVAYQNALTDIEKNRVNATAEVNTSYDAQALQNAISFADKVLANNQNRMNSMYSLHRDNAADAQYASSMAYQQGRDAASDLRYDTEWQYGVSQDTQAEALRKAQTMADVGNFDGYRALGYSDAEIASLQKGYYARTAAKGTGSGGAGTPSAESTGYDALFQDALASGNPQSFISNNYKRYGFTSSSGLYNDFKAWNTISDDAKVSNPHSDDWVSVGSGRITWNELMGLVESGEIKEEYDPATNTITYKKR